MKLCKDCKHYKRDYFHTIISFGNKSFDHLNHFCLRETSTINGSPRSRYCDHERQYSCGPEGKYWEEKE